MTAGEVVDRIKKHLGVAWRDTTYRDTYKFGGPDTSVTGIATTAFVSIEVIQRAAAAGLNMIIPHEVTFWNDRDDTSVVSRDPLYSSKVGLLEKHNIVVFRIHDHMHAQRPRTSPTSDRRATSASRASTRPRPARIASSSRKPRSGRWRPTSSDAPERARCGWSATLPLR